LAQSKNAHDRITFLSFFISIGKLRNGF